MKFNEKYNAEQFSEFLESFLPIDYAEKAEDIIINKTRYKQITKAKILGYCKSLDLSVMELDHNHENDPRVTIATDAFKIMADHWIHQALIVFKNNESNNYRFSYLTIKLELGDKNKAIQKYSNARRYSFYLGEHAKVRTPEQQLIKKGRVESTEDLFSRFSVEVVNKQFYLEVARYFDELVSDLVLPSVPEEDISIKKNFAVRLIGRLMFCWFLKQKKSANGQLVPDEILSSRVVADNYYHNSIEPLFFGVLNTSMESRDIRSELFDKVPYLNGGLFNPQADDFYEVDRGTFTSKFINTLKIKDTWFKDFFEFLETYNFTIDENTVFDQELSVDPEMLGRIFENLLAEINPETGSSERKRTGSFYTPRQIVEYMVDQSLIEYLKTKTGIDGEKIAALVSYDLMDDIEYPLNEEEKQKIVSAIDMLRILDPACGSGAYPMGALQKIVYILQQVDPDCKLWLDQRLKDVPDLYKQKIINEIKSNPFDYTRKLDVIKNSIFGVDIQPIAVDVSRLRCFLTLVVESEINDSKPNRGIVPLPNLDFKFVCANTLIPAPEQDGVDDATLFGDNFQEMLAIAVDKYFASSGENKRAANNEIHRLIDGKVDQKLKYLKSLVSYNGDEKIESLLAKGKKKQIDLHSKILSLWSSYKNIFDNKPVGFFDQRYFFPGVNNGFDIVIANPPYIDSEGMVNSGQANVRDSIQQAYAWARGNWDIYIAFFEFGFKNINNSGVLSYITPDKWISKPFGEKLREGIFGNIFCIAQSGRGVFDSAKVDSIITFISKRGSNFIRVMEYRDNNFLEKRSVDKKTIFSPFSLDYLFSNNLDLIEKINSSDGKISQIATCENACATSDAYALKPLLKNYGDSNIDKTLYFKIINTGTIGRYYMRWGHKDMSYLKDKYAFPVVLREEFLKKFHNSYGKKAVKPKIIIKGLNLLDACLDLDGSVVPGKTTLIIASLDVNDLKFILGLINSKFSLYYIKGRYPASSYNQGISFTKDMINNFPLPIISQDIRSKIIAIVDEIILMKEKNFLAETANLELQIDELVMCLYGLNDEEKEIIRNS